MLVAVRLEPVYQESLNPERHAKMCTNIVKQVEVAGSGKGTGGWFPVSRVNVSFDHPFDADFEHALNIDFVNEALGPAARVAVELSQETARSLAETILEVLAQAAQDGVLEVRR